MREALEIHLDRRLSRNLNITTLRIQWKLVLQPDSCNPMHAHEEVLEAMKCRRVLLCSPGRKRGAVDTQLKALMNELLDATRADTNAQRAANGRHLVVVLSGDSDFGDEIKRMLQRYLSVVQIYLGNPSKALRSTVQVGMTDRASQSWELLVRSCSNHAGGGNAFPWFQQPRGTPRRTPRSASPASSVRSTASSRYRGRGGGFRSPGGYGSAEFRRTIPRERVLLPRQKGKFFEVAYKAKLQALVASVHPELSVFAQPDIDRSRTFIEVKAHSGCPNPREKLAEAVAEIERVSSQLRQLSCLVQAKYSEIVAPKCLALMKERNMILYVAKPAEPNPDDCQVYFVAPTGWTKEQATAAARRMASPNVRINGLQGMSDEKRARHLAKGRMFVKWRLQLADIEGKSRKKLDELGFLLISTDSETHDGISVRFEGNQAFACRTHDTRPVYFVALQPPAGALEEARAVLLTHLGCIDRMPELPAAPEETKCCAVCLEDFPLHQAGLTCQKDADHFVCDTCIQEHIRSMDGPAGLREFTLKCFDCTYLFNERTVSQCLDDDTYAVFHRLIRQAMLVAEQRAEAAREEEQRRLQALRTAQERANEAAHHHVTEAILTDHCPSCGTAVYDWVHCNAVKCGTCAKYFCGHCMTGHSESDAAHACALRCSGTRNYYGDVSESRKQRRQVALDAYVATLLPEHVADALEYIRPVVEDAGLALPGVAAR